MAIQQRRGSYTDFVPSRLVAGELAVVQSGDTNTDDGKAIYVAVSAGSAKRLAFAEEIDGKFDSITEELEGLVDDAEAAAEAAAQLYRATDDNNDGNITIILGGGSEYS